MIYRPRLGRQAPPRSVRARITLLGQSDRRLVLDLQACSDERILILGSHATDLPALAEPGFATRHPQALYEAEPGTGAQPRAAHRGTAGRGQRRRPPARGDRADTPVRKRGGRAVELRARADGRSPPERAGAGSEDDERRMGPPQLFVPWRNTTRHGPSSTRQARSRRPRRHVYRTRRARSLNAETVGERTRQNRDGGK